VCLMQDGLLTKQASLGQQCCHTVRGTAVMAVTEPPYHQNTHRTDEQHIADGGTTCRFRGRSPKASTCFIAAGSWQMLQQCASLSHDTQCLALTLEGQMGTAKLPLRNDSMYSSSYNKAATSFLKWL